MTPEFAVIAAWALFVPAASLITFGISAVCAPGFAGYPLRRALAVRLPDVLLTPLLLCPTCMSSVYTIALGVPFGRMALSMNALPLALALALSMLAVAGLNSIISHIINKDEN